MRIGQRIGFTLVLFTSCFILTPCYADVVYLKTGKKIECHSAWEEAKEVKYMIGDGIVGIPKSMVAKIVRSKKPSVHASAAPVSGEPEAPAQVLLNPGQLTAGKVMRANQFNETGRLLAEKKDFNGALENFQKAYELSKDIEITLNLALAYTALDDIWNAELYFHEALKKDPKQTMALNYLGEIAWKREELNEAESFWRRSLEIKNDKSIQQKLAKVLKEKKTSLAYDNSSSRHFLMKYDGGTANPRLVTEISDFLEETYQQLSSRFDAYPTVPFVVVLYPRTAFFNSTDAPMWSAGLNDGKIKLPLMGVKSMNEELRGILVHELTHSFINYKTAGNCPVWLQEGLAQYSEGKRTSTEGREILRKLAQNNNLPAIQRLSGSFSGANANAAGIIYAESLAFTEFLVHRYRFYRVNEMLNLLGKGESLEDAFQNAFSISVAGAQSDWHNQLVRE